MENEKEVKRFFFTVANNPLYYPPPSPYSYQSLLNMTEPYLTSLKTIPKTSKYYHYSRGIIEGLFVKTGRLKDDLWLKDDYKPGVSYYTEKELNSFYIRRTAFIEILEKIASGVPLTEIAGLDIIGIRASELQPAPYFEVSGGTMKAVEYPSGADITSNKIDGYKELIGITRFGFLSLTLFLADGGGGRIKRCARCNKFFSRERDDERNRFCSDDCRKTHNQGQRKTDEGKAQRAAYMRGRRAVLRERKRAKERTEQLKRLMDGGYTRKQAEKYLNDGEA